MRAANANGWSDTGNAPPGYTYQWQKLQGGKWENIAAATDQTLGSVHFISGEWIKVICTPYDGQYYGTPREDPLVIL
jgi:hypothetical protein